MFRLITESTGARWCSGTPPLGDSSYGQASILPTSLFRLPPPPLSRASVFRTLSISATPITSESRNIAFSFRDVTADRRPFTSLAFRPFPFPATAFGVRAVPRCHTLIWAPFGAADTHVSYITTTSPSARDWVPRRRRDRLTSLAGCAQWRLRCRYKPLARLG